MSGPGWRDNRSQTSRAVEPDAAIVARARHDPRAFAPLYERYLDPVFRYCYRRLGNREAAEDATGQVFARAMAALPRFEPTREESVRAWLFAIARNIVVDGYRTGAVGSATPLPLDAASALVAGGRDRRKRSSAPRPAGTCAPCWADCRRSSERSSSCGSPG